MAVQFGGDGILARFVRCVGGSLLQLRFDDLPVCIHILYGIGGVNAGGSALRCAVDLHQRPADLLSVGIGFLAGPQHILQRFLCGGVIGAAATGRGGQNAAAAVRGGDGVDADLSGGPGCGRFPVAAHLGADAPGRAGAVVEDDKLDHAVDLALVVAARHCGGEADRIAGDRGLLSVRDGLHRCYRIARLCAVLGGAVPAVQGVGGDDIERSHRHSALGRLPRRLIIVCSAVPVDQVSPVAGQDFIDSAVDVLRVRILPPALLQRVAIVFGPRFQGLGVVFAPL